MSNIVEIKAIKNNKRTTKRTNQYTNNNYFNLISKLNNEEEYKENEIAINVIEKILVLEYKVPYNLLAMLVDNINEKVAMEYEAI